MPWYKLEINFHLPEDLKNPDNIADDIEAQCFQIVNDWADDTGMDLVFEIPEKDKNI